jgi:hypothetical protein
MLACRHRLTCDMMNGCCLFHYREYVGEGDVDKERAEIRDVRVPALYYLLSTKDVVRMQQLAECARHLRLVLHALYTKWTLVDISAMCHDNLNECSAPPALQRNPFSKEQEGGTQIGGGGEGSAS